MNTDNLLGDYDPKRVKEEPNENVRNIKRYNLLGERITNEQLTKLVVEVDAQRVTEATEVFNPGLDMSVKGITLKYANMGKQNKLAIDTLYSRVLGNVNVPDPKKKEVYERIGKIKM